MAIQASEPVMPPRDWPVYWFAELARAFEAGDLVAAARAQQELERLGVTVRYRRLQQPAADKKGGAA